MVEETIKTIKETENKADEIIRKADTTCTEILENAAKEAKKIKEQAVAEAKQKAEADFLKVREDGENQKAEASKITGQDMEALKALAETKEEEAVAVVMEALLD